MAQKMNATWCFRWLAAAAVILALIVGRAAADAEVLCVDAYSQLLPCGDFLRDKAAAPNADCCAGVTYLDKNAKESPDIRRILCECTKENDDLPFKTPKGHQLLKLCKASDKLYFGPNVNCVDLM